MKKVIKTGLSMLATTACALTFAYAQPTTVEKQTEPYSLEKAAEVYEEYIWNFKTVKNDNKITYKEFKQIHDYLEKHLPSMSIKSQTDIKKLVDYFNGNVKDKYIKQEVKDPETQEEFRKIIKNLEEKVLTYFPNLINKNNTSINYQSTQQLDQDHNQIVNELISKAYNHLKQKKDESLQRLTKKNQFTIQDLLTFYSILNNKKSLFGLKTVQKEQKKEKLLLVNILEHKRIYDAFLEDIEKWKNGGVYCFPFISAGARPYIGGFTTTQPPGVSDEKIKQLFNCEMEDIEETFPPKTLIPHWLGLILSLGGVVAVKGLITTYTKRKIWDGSDAGEIIFSTMLSWIFDAIHPLVFPMRVFALPVITEKLRKSFSRE